MTNENEKFYSKREPKINEITGEQYKLSMATYPKWVNQCRSGDEYAKQEAVKAREYARREIADLNEQIAVLRAKIAKPLPKARDRSKEAYEADVAATKERTIAEGEFIWEEPEARATRYKQKEGASPSSAKSPVQEVMEGD
jgi:hypothetical protein